MSTHTVQGQGKSLKRQLNPEKSKASSFIDEGNVREAKLILENNKGRRSGGDKSSNLVMALGSKSAPAFDACCMMLIEVLLLRTGFTHAPKDALSLLESMVVINKSEESFDLCNEVFFQNWMEVKSGKNHTPSHARWSHR